MSKIKIAIDAGHGWGNVKSGQFDPGATGNGVREADVALDYAKSLKEMLLRRKVPCHMIVTGLQGDENPVSRRDDEATANGCTHMVSIHCNAFTEGSRGIETLYRTPEDKALAEIMHKATLASLGLKDRGLFDESRSPHGRLAVFSFPGPNCLVELGFLTNAEDVRALRDPKRRIAWAEAVADELAKLK